VNILKIAKKNKYMLFLKQQAIFFIFDNKQQAILTI
jgi:hypothetical protein